MDNSIYAVRLVIIFLLAMYEVYAFRNGKQLKSKLLPMILLVSIGLLFIALVPFIGVIGSIFAILLVELSIICSMLVILGEIVLILFSRRRNIKKVLQLVSVFLLLALIYYIGERVF